ncbi:MAG: HEPN domain-containing protein [Candidatus Margulisbacteria bacterium]|jgi:HEPN domain-containing protein|nr:HEPN domain-containing protein [Candidatus Margulisiibacteriota bacterium]
MKNSYQVWLQRAKSSLALAQTAISKSICYEDLCFQAQQSAEKALKALLIFYGIEPEKTHNLDNLLKIIERHIDIPKKIRESINLTPYAAQTRYPGDYLPLNKKEYLAAVRIAENCLQWVEKKIKTGSQQLTL